MSPTHPERASSPGRTLTRRTLLRATGLGAGALAFPSVLAACSGGDSGSSNTQKDLKDVPQVQLGADTTGVLYPEGYVGPKASAKTPFADGSKKFRVVVPSDVQVVGDWNKSTATAWFKQRTGIDVEFEGVLTTAADGSVDLTKINAILASGDLPDAFMGIQLSRDQISLYGSQGVFVALDDYIDTYAPEMRRMQQDYPGFASLNAAADGKRYAFNGINDCYHCRIGNQRTWVNTEYLDAVGASMPTTTDELRETLIKLKQNDPSPGKNLIPFAGVVTQGMDTVFMNAFTYNPGGRPNGTNEGGWLRVADDKVEFAANTDEWRQALQYMNTLFNDGTLPRTSFTTPAEAFLRGGNQGRYGFARAWYWGDFADIKYTDGALWKNYETMGPIAGPSGANFSAWNHFSYYYAAGTGLVITSKCENPELLVQWADAQMELEAIMVGYGGTKGTNWEWAPKGGTSIMGKQPVYQLQTWPPPVGQSWNQYSVMYRSNDFRLSQFIDPKSPNFEKELYEASKKYEAKQITQEQQLPPLLFDESSAAQRSDIALSVYNHVSQSMAQFAIGELDVNSDSVWQAYTKKLEDMGLPTYLKLYQDAFDKRPK